MSVSYGLLKGKVIDGIRAEVVEDEVNSAHVSSGHYRSNHYHLIIEAKGEKWRCPINVRSQDNSEVWFKIRDAFTNHPILNELPDIPEGLHELPQRKAGWTLDFIREPLFDRTTMRHLPLNVAGANNDVQDHVELYAKQAQNDPNAIAYVFGSFWRNQQFPPDKILQTNQGVHDIHMNQGNDPGHKGDDGVYQDGGVILYFPQTNRYVGIFLAFNSQVWFTNNQNGHALPGHKSGPLAETAVPVEPTPTPEQPTPTPEQPTSGGDSVRIIAALLNPRGDDAGQETVTLFNASPGAITLDGWKLQDRQNHIEDLSGIHITRNESKTIRLSGRGVQLSNKGGALRLLDSKDQLIDVVTYTQDQAISDRITVF